MTLCLAPTTNMYRSTSPSPILLRHVSEWYRSTSPNPRLLRHISEWYRSTSPTPIPCRSRVGPTLFCSDTSPTRFTRNDIVSTSGERSAPREHSAVLHSGLCVVNDNIVTSILALGSSGILCWQCRLPPRHGASSQVAGMRRLFALQMQVAQCVHTSAPSDTTLLTCTLFILRCLLLLSNPRRVQPSLPSFVSHLVGNVLTFLDPLHLGL